MEKIWAQRRRAAIRQCSANVSRAAELVNPPWGDAEALCGEKVELWLRGNIGEQSGRRLAETKKQSDIEDIANELRSES